MHLALYTMKLVYLLPKMVSAGTTQIEDDWSMVVDLTDNLESRISRIACLDAERMLNDFRSYIRATYCIDLVQNGIDKSNKSVEEALNEIKQGVDQSEFKTRLSILRQDLPESDEKSFDQKDLDELLEYYDDNDYFGKFVHVLEVSNLGNSQYKYLREFIDAVTMKNSPSMLLATGALENTHVEEHWGQNYWRHLSNYWFWNRQKMAHMNHVRFQSMNWHNLFVIGMD